MKRKPINPKCWWVLAWWFGSWRPTVDVAAEPKRLRLSAAKREARAWMGLGTKTAVAPYGRRTP